MNPENPAKTDEEILAALERWLKRIQDPNDVMIGFNAGKKYTFREAVREVRNKTKFGEKLIAGLKKIAETHGRDIIEFIDSST